MIEYCNFVFLEEINKDEFKNRVKAKPKVSLEQFEDLMYYDDWVDCPDWGGCWTDIPVCINYHDWCCPLEFPNYYQYYYYSEDIVKGYCYSDTIT